MSSQPIQTGVPATRVPGQYLSYSSSSAQQGLPLVPQRALILGQMLGTGTAAPLAPVQIYSGGQGYAAFGAGSQLGQMVESFVLNNSTIELWAVGVADLVAGTAAVFTATVAGPATAAGTLPLYIEGVSVPVGVSLGDSAAVIAGNIAAAVNATPNLSVTAAAAAAAAVVTLTARHKGLGGNSIDMRLGLYPTDVVPAGVAVVFAQPTAGAGNPNIATAWPGLGDKHFTAIVTPWIDGANLTALTTECARRWGPLVKGECLAYTAARVTMSAAAALGATLNSQYLTVLPAQNVPTSPWRIAAMYAGEISYYGAMDPTRPFQTLPLIGMVPPTQADIFTRAERELLLADGCSTFKVNDAGQCTIERAITTYQTNAAGAPDASWLDVNVPLALMTLGYQTRNWFATRYPRCSLADDGVAYGPSQNVMTPGLGRSEMLALGTQWLAAGLIDDFAAFQNSLVVQRDASNRNQLDVGVTLPLVGQLITFAAAISFQL